MSKLVKFAKEFALKHHGEQDHGCLKIGTHLADVARHAGLHSGNDPVVMAAAWLHDVVEDTKVTRERLENAMFKEGLQAHDIYDVIRIVKAVTDKPGKGRKERHLNTYWSIRENEDALLVKLCDRRHNHERSIKHGEIYAAMYAKEYDYFKFALWKPRQYPELWSELDKQNKKLQEIVGW